MRSPLTPDMVTLEGAAVADSILSRISKRFPYEMKSVQCSVEPCAAAVSVDFELIAAAATEIFNNAFQFREAEGTIEWRACAAGDDFTVEWTESKTSVAAPTETWGREPFDIHAARRMGARPLPRTSDRRRAARPNRARIPRRPVDDPARHPAETRCLTPARERSSSSTTSGRS